MHSPGGNPTAYLQATGSQPTTSSPVRLITDTLAPGGGSGNGVTVAASASSFSWADAGIGAGCVAALVLLIALVRTARPAQIRRVAL
jgi:hypothetical protein